MLLWKEMNSNFQGKPSVIVHFTNKHDETHL